MKKSPRRYIQIVLIDNRHSNSLYGDKTYLFDPELQWKLFEDFKLHFQNRVGFKSSDQQALAALLIDVFVLHSILYICDRDAEREGLNFFSDLATWDSFHTHFLTSCRENFLLDLVQFSYNFLNLCYQLPHCSCDRRKLSKTSNMSPNGRYRRAPTISSKDKLMRPIASMTVKVTQFKY